MDCKKNAQPGWFDKDGNLFTNVHTPPGERIISVLHFDGDDPNDDVCFDPRASACTPRSIELMTRMRREPGVVWCHAAKTEIESRFFSPKRG